MNVETQQQRLKLSKPFRKFSFYIYVLKMSPLTMVSPKSVLSGDPLSIHLWIIFDKNHVYCLVIIYFSTNSFGFWLV